MLGSISAGRPEVLRSSGCSSATNFSAFGLFIVA
jgi:hypothetical protein